MEQVLFAPGASICPGCGFKYGHNVECPWVKMKIGGGERMERIDRKFTFSGTCTEHDPPHAISQDNAVVFLVKDRLLVPTLRHYLSLAEGEDAVEERQNIGLRLLIERVERYQQEHLEEMKFPDVEPGPAGDPIVAPNEPA